MYQNQIYMCIFWCSKIFWFPMKKCWCQQKSRDASGDLYFFLDLPYVRYNCAKFHHCRIGVADFGDGGGCQKAPSHPWAVPKKPILNRVKTVPIVIYCCFALHNICEMGRICEVDDQEVQAQIQRHKRDEEKTPNRPGAFCSYINSEG